MNAVAIITPDPKYFVMKKAKGGTRMRFVRAAAIGSKAPIFELALLWAAITRLLCLPSIDPRPMTKIEDIRRPKRPSYSFPPPHSYSIV